MRGTTKDKLSTDCSSQWFWDKYTSQFEKLFVNQSFDAVCATPWRDQGLRLKICIRCLLNFYAALMTISYTTIIGNNSPFNAIFLFFSLSQDQLDKLGVALRNACRDDELDLVNKPMIYIIDEKQEWLLNLSKRKDKSLLLGEPSSCSWDNWTACHELAGLLKT